MISSYLADKRNMPMGVKSLLLKNQYLLDLHHKSDNQNTYQKWRDIVDKGQIQGLKAIVRKEQPPWYMQEDVVRTSTTTLSKTPVAQKSILKQSLAPSPQKPVAATTMRQTVKP